MPARDTGFPSRDATDDFMRARRRQTLRRLAQRVARTPGDVDVILPFDEVVAELGRVGERELGLQTVALDSVVGTVDKPHGFDRSFRPTTPHVRGRWERIAQAMRRGEPIPPVSLYRVGDVHFVRDGHHRVSVARALGLREIDAYVTEVRTRVGAEGSLTLADLPVKGHERLFRERVPLPREAAERVVLSDPWKYGDLAEGVEAWGFRASQERGELLDRATTARAWFEHEFVPVVAMLRDAGLVGDDETEADAYERLGGERYQLMRTMEWSEDIVRRLAESRSRRARRS
ncbi:MAG: chromosome partitioning protein ParB [Actinomycetota bacterium]|nr:chromosome partitioning protein ParB [Actinomycetota bacterium]